MIYRELEGRLGYLRDPSTGIFSLFVTAGPEDVLAVVPGTYIETVESKPLFFGRLKATKIPARKEYHISAKHINDGIFNSFPELRELALSKEFVKIGIYEP